jgi:hypothetical protein
MAVFCVVPYRLLAVNVLEEHTASIHSPEAAYLYPYSLITPSFGAV